MRQNAPNPISISIFRFLLYRQTPGEGREGREGKGGEGKGKEGKERGGGFCVIDVGRIDAMVLIP